MRSFPLAEQIVDLDDDVQPPSYLVDQPLKDLSDVFMTGSDDFRNIDILEDWPKNVNCALDSSQIEALQRILTKQLAIVQGPPGKQIWTGFSHCVSPTFHFLDLPLRRLERYGSCMFGSMIQLKENHLDRQY